MKRRAKVGLGPGRVGISHFFELTFPNPEEQNNATMPRGSEIVANFGLQS